MCYNAEISLNTYIFGTIIAIILLFLNLGWFLSKVEVECPSIGMKQVFPCEKWLAKDEGFIKIINYILTHANIQFIY